MKRQKLAVCVLSAALMIGAATLTSYAAEGWQQSGNSWIYVDNNGNKVTNTWKKGADNLWRYLDSQGNIASNCWVDDEYFVESTGIMATDKWLKLPKRNPAWNETSATTVWYYFSTSGKMVSDGWSKIGGKYYYFDGDGAMQTGWVDDDTYYTNAEGVMQIGWAYLEDPDDTKKDDDEVKPGDDDEDHHWYYFQSSGKKYVPSLGGAKYKQYKIDGTYYCFDENGAMQTGWVDMGNSSGFANYRYYQSNGQVQTGWLSTTPPEDDDYNLDLGSDVQWYYFSSNGEPKVGPKISDASTSNLVRINADVRADAGEGAVILALLLVLREGGQERPVGDVIDAVADIPEDVGDGEENDVGRAGADIAEEDQVEDHGHDAADKDRGLELAPLRVDVVDDEAGDGVVQRVGDTQDGEHKTYRCEHMNG